MSASLRLMIGVGVWVLLASFGLSRAAAMGMEGFGPMGQHLGRSPDWAKGVEDVLRHGSGVYWNDVNGHTVCYYDGDVRTINELLDLFSRVDLAEHAVIIRPGRPSAKSFQGTLTPYVVNFDVPAGIYMFQAQRNAGTGLYLTVPRMSIYFDAALAEKLDQLKIPKNVKLYTTPARVEDALAHVDDADPTLRYLAISALGEAAETSDAITAALKRAAESENLRDAAEAAQRKIAAEQEPAEQALRQRLAKFIDDQPQRAKLPSAQELFDALRKADTDYTQGFTARGTMVEPQPSGPGTLVAWTITMGDGRLVVERRRVEDAEHPPAQGRIEDTIFVSPEKMATIYGHRTWVDGELREMKPMATFEPVGPNYDLLIGRLLWPLGRGISRRMDRVTSLLSGSDGLLTVAAESDSGGLKQHWELLVDPQANFLVREAKFFFRDDKEPTYTVESAGVLFGDERSVNHTARWIEGSAGLAASVAVTSVSNKPDTDLIRRTEERLESMPKSPLSQ